MISGLCIKFFDLVDEMLKEGFRMYPPSNDKVVLPAHEAVGRDGSNGAALRKYWMTLLYDEKLEWMSTYGYNFDTLWDRERSKLRVYSVPYGETLDDAITRSAGDTVNDTLTWPKDNLKMMKDTIDAMESAE